MQRLFVFVVLALVARDARAGFTTGDVFAHNYDGEVRNITAGGDYTGVPPFVDAVFTDVGKMAWSADLSTMYLSVVQTGSVLAVDSSGFVSTFATGLSAPMGLVRTTGGQLLVAEFGSGQVTNITAGGNFSAAAPFAAGLSNPCDLAQLPDGRVMAAEYTGGEISDITGGGIIGAGQSFVNGIGACTSIVVSPSGGLMATASQTSTVWSVTPGGVKSVFGNNAGIWGLAYAASGALLAADYAGGGRVLDISAGGDLAAAPAFATGLVDTNSLSVVPVPEPAAVSLIAVAGLALARRRRR